MPSWPSTINWPGSRNWPAGNAWPSSNNWPADFNGSFASLFPGAYQVLQTDLGLTYGGTLLAAAGNTSTTAVTLTGTLSTAPVPIRVKATTVGTVAIGSAIFSIYYDGGTTPAMTGVTPTAGVPVALTGAAAGLSLAWAAGNAVLNDTWNATCSALADQSGNSTHAVQSTASLQPIVGVGLNGKPSLIFDGVDDYMSTAAIAIPIGAMLYMVYRYKSIVAGAYVTDGIPADHMHIQIAAGPNTDMYNGASLTGGGVFGGANIYGRLAATFNSVSSSLKVGSSGIVSGNSGALASGTGRTIAISGALTLPSNIEILALIWAPPTALAGPDSAINSLAGYGPGAIVV